jgi:hypothetical protein
MDLDTQCRRAQQDMTELAEEHGPPTQFATIPQRWPYDARHVRRDTSRFAWWDSPAREGGPAREAHETAADVCPGLDDEGLFA